MAKTTLTQTLALELAIQIISSCYSNEVIKVNGDISIDLDELIDKLNSMLTAIKNKSHRPSKADTLKQIENDKVADIIIATLMDSENPMTITEMQKSNEELAKYSNQKISAIVRKLIDSAQVTKTIDKKKSYFSVC